MKSILSPAVQLSRLTFFVVLAALMAPPAAFCQDIALQLLFDGEPLVVAATPEFACLDRTRDKWIGCRIEREADGNRYVLARPAPGEYTLHIKIDENTKNPARFPGDYDVFYPFEVTAATPAELRVDVPKLIRVTAPWDNDRDLNGMLAKPWSEKPGFRISGPSASGVAAVTFDWDSIVPGAEYHYIITTARNDPYHRWAGDHARNDTQHKADRASSAIARRALFPLRDLSEEGRTCGR